MNVEIRLSIGCLVTVNMNPLKQFYSALEDLMSAI